MRPLEITRAEAEDLVDLLEKHSAGRPDRFALADDIRRTWGMAPSKRSTPKGTLTGSTLTGTAKNPAKR